MACHGKRHPSEPNVLLIKEFSTSCQSSEEDSSDEGGNSSVAERHRDRSPSAVKNEQKNPVYVNVQKLVRAAKDGNETTTIHSLTALREENLLSEIVQNAVEDAGGLEILANLLTADDKPCQMASLMILRDVASNRRVARKLTDLGVVPNIVEMLEDKGALTRRLAAETIANLARCGKARKICRKTNGLVKLVNMLDVPEYVLTTTSKGNLKWKERRVLDIGCAAVSAVRSVSESRKNCQRLHELNLARFCGRFLKCSHSGVVVDVLGAITKCAALPDFQKAVEREGFMQEIVRNLDSKNKLVQKKSVEALFKCVESVSCSDFIRHTGGLDPLMNLLKDERTKKDKELLIAVAGAVWRCARNPGNLPRLKELDAVPAFVQLLTYENEQVLTHATGALAALADDTASRDNLMKCGGIPLLVNLINATCPLLLINVCRVVRECATHSGCIKQINECDGLRLLWSLFRNENTGVRGAAASALVPCIQNTPDSADIIRNFAGGLELLATLLQHVGDEKALSSICAAVSEVAKNKENLAILTDLGVVRLLARLTTTKRENLRRHLASAIANCCKWNSNRRSFGELKAAKRLVPWIKSKNIHVRKSACVALYELSFDAENCAILHGRGIVKLLLRTIASEDDDVQEYSAGCLRNIRKLALELSG